MGRMDNKPPKTWSRQLHENNEKYILGGGYALPKFLRVSLQRFKIPQGRPGAERTGKGNGKAVT